LQSEFSVLSDDRLDNGEAVLFRHTPGRRVAAAKCEHGTGSKSKEAPLDFGDGQLGIERHCRCRTCNRNDRQSRLRTVRDRHCNPGVTTEPGLAQIRADRIDLILQFPI
jgi:hypothetical protein